MTRNTTALKTRLSNAHDAIRCFNVAAITALAVWHGYLFYLNHLPAEPRMQLISIDSQMKNNCCLRLIEK